MSVDTESKRDGTAPSCDAPGAVELRPHHALCILKFTGHGYDERFTRHMTGLVRALAADGSREITVRRGCDFLCSACPENMGGVCRTREKTESMDEAALSALGVEVGDTLTWCELSQRACRLFRGGGWESVCRGCQWYELCRGTASGMIDDIKS